MKLKRIQCSPLVYAKGVAVSPSYIIGCTGRRVVVLDRQFNLRQSIEGLDYVYSAKVSPDEQQLLLISNGNEFYMAELCLGEKRGVTVRPPYHYNLEGNGCWSFDGEALFLLVTNRTTMNSTLRRYHSDDLTKYEDFLAEQYILMQIHPLEKHRQYLLIGNSSADGRTYFIYFDGHTFTEYPLENSAMMVVFGSSVDSESGSVVLYSTEGCCRYSAEGKYMETIAYPQSKMKEPPDSLNPNTTEVRYDITKYAVSACGKYIFVSAESGFLVKDAQTGETLAEITEEFGVQNFEQVAPDIVALATWNGVKLYRMTDD